jgi:HEPN domain-containing protein
MNAETGIWMRYALENERSAEILFSQTLFNTCLQNAQQAIEKYLKAALVEKGVPVRHTHSIGELVDLARGAGVEVLIIDDEIELIDSIYLPSKYPVGSALPDFVPDEAVCRRCVGIAHAVADSVRKGIPA